MLLRHSQQQLLGCHGHHDQAGGHDDREWQTDWWPFRAYFINIFNDFFPCVISPCVFIFNAPVIRRGMEQKVRNVVVDIYDISYCLWWNNTPLSPRWRAGWSCWGWAQVGSWGRGGWGTTTTWWTAGTPAPALAPVWSRSADGGPNRSNLKKKCIFTVVFYFFLFIVTIFISYY